MTIILKKYQPEGLLLKQRKARDYVLGLLSVLGEEKDERTGD